MLPKGKVILSFYDKTPNIELPIYEGTSGPDVIDVSTLYAKTGKFAYDPGFISTAICSSEITYIDGNNGILLYRGYAIQDLARNCDFLEICYLLLKGDLPNVQKKNEFNYAIMHHTMVHEQMQFFLRGFRRDAHPMSILTGLIGSMAAFYHNELLDIQDSKQRNIAQIRLIAKIPTLVAMAYKYSIGQPFIYPKNDLSYTANFMRMMFATPCEEYQINNTLVRALDQLFILHADHEQNASTTTVRLAGSSGSNPFAAIAAGVACLWGPIHGGANEASLQMLEKIQAMGGEKNIGKFIAQVKDKNNDIRLIGFGHRIYKNFDPRAQLMREICYTVLQELNLENDPLFHLAMTLEKIALEDEYFISHKLYPNIDFYSGIAQRALGIPIEMFTCIFALARTVGWIAQWEEMITDSEHKIARPRQLFVGKKMRSIQN